MNNFQSFSKDRVSPHLRGFALFGVRPSAPVSHVPPKLAAHGVPALAGQTQYCLGSRNEWSRLEEATPCRLKPGLDALSKPTFRYEKFRSGRQTLSGTLKRGQQTR